MIFEILSVKYDLFLICRIHENNGKFMKFSRQREMSLVKPEMSLVKFQNVPGKCLESVATLFLTALCCINWSKKNHRAIHFFNA